MNKRNIMGMLFHLLTFVLTLMLIIGIDVYNFKFDWSKITWEYFSIRVLISLGYTIIKVSVSNFVYDMREVQDESYRDIMGTLFTQSKLHRGNKFNKAVNKFDYSLKREEWIKKMEMKEFKHQRRMGNKIALELKEYKPENYSKKTIKWLKKLDEINLMLTDKWINENLLVQKIRYPEITPLEVLYGSIEYTPEKSYLDRKPLMRIILKSMPFMVLTLAGTLLLGALTDIYASGGIGLFVAITSILVVLVLNITMGIINALRAHRSRFINANKRSEIFLDYKEGVYDALPDIPHRIKKFENTDEPKELHQPEENIVSKDYVDGKSDNMEQLSMMDELMGTMK